MSNMNERDSDEILRVRLIALKTELETIKELPAPPTFIKNVTDCENHYELKEKEQCLLVDMDRVVDKSLSIIKNLVKEMSSNRLAVPPLVFTRLAGGGKTATLDCVFEKLKLSTNLTPIGISFGGQGDRAFHQRVEETQSQAILRLIAAQLVDCSREDSHKLLVDQDKLDTYLGDNVVLLIDDLHRLTDNKPLDFDAVVLLRQMFLDKPGRYLVYSTNVPISMDIAMGKGNAAIGGRGVKIVNMSQASSLKELQTLPGCAALTESQAALFGYIPALVRTSIAEKMDKMYPYRPFISKFKRVPEGEQFYVLGQFIAQLLTGKRCDSIKSLFGHLSSVDENGMYSYPLYYVKQIFEALLPESNEVRGLLNVIKKLETCGELKTRGLVLECTVQLAVILRCLSSSFFGTRSPFGIVPVGVKPTMVFVQLPSSLKTPTEAQSFIDTEMNKYCKPTLIYIDTGDRKYTVESVVVYTNGQKGEGEEQVVKKFGFQTKPDHNRKNKIDMCDGTILDHVYVIGGRTMAANPPPSVQKAGWSYLSVEEVRQFIGTSLQMAVPEDIKLVTSKSVVKRVKKKAKKTKSVIGQVLRTVPDKLLMSGLSTKKFSTLSCVSRDVSVSCGGVGLLPLDAMSRGLLSDRQLLFQSLLSTRRSNVQLLKGRGLCGTKIREVCTLTRFSPSIIMYRQLSIPFSALQVGLTRVMLVVRVLLK